MISNGHGVVRSGQPTERQRIVELSGKLQTVLQRDATGRVIWRLGSLSDLGKSLKFVKHNTRDNRDLFVAIT